MNYRQKIANKLNKKADGDYTAGYTQMAIKTLQDLNNRIMDDEMPGEHQVVLSKIVEDAILKIMKSTKAEDPTVKEWRSDEELDAEVERQGV
jgi:hypothetical protein